MRQYDKAAVAARLRGLIGGQEKGDLAAVAARLAVDEIALRISIDELAPHPTIDVIAAVIRVYAVDPSWLLCGEYDAAMHRHSLESNTDEMRVVVDEFVRSIVPETTGPAKLHLVKEA